MRFRSRSRSCGRPLDSRGRGRCDRRRRWCAIVHHRDEAARTEHGDSRENPKAPARSIVVPVVGLEWLGPAAREDEQPSRNARAKRPRCERPRDPPAHGTLPKGVGRYHHARYGSQAGVSANEKRVFRSEMECVARQAFNPERSLPAPQHPVAKVHGATNTCVMTPMAEARAESVFEQAALARCRAPLSTGEISHTQRKASSRAARVRVRSDIHNDSSWRRDRWDRRDRRRAPPMRRPSACEAAPGRGERA